MEKATSSRDRRRRSGETRAWRNDEAEFFGLAEEAKLLRGHLQRLARSHVHVRVCAEVQINEERRYENVLTVLRDISQVFHYLSFSAIHRIRTQLLYSTPRQATVLLPLAHRAQSHGGSWDFRRGKRVLNLRRSVTGGVQSLKSRGKPRRARLTVS